MQEQEQNVKNIELKKVRECRKQEKVQNRWKILKLTIMELVMKTKINMVSSEIKDIYSLTIQQLLGVYNLSQKLQQDRKQFEQYYYQLEKQKQIMKNKLIQINQVLSINSKVIGNEVEQFFKQNQQFIGNLHIK